MKQFIYIFFAGLLVASCGSSEQPAEAAEETASEAIQLSAEQMQFNQIEVGKLPQGEVFHVIKSAGVVDVPPNFSVKLSAPVEAYVSKVLVLPGDRVEKGEVLAHLTHPAIAQVQQDYLSTKSQLEFMKADLARKGELLDGKTVSQRTYEQLKSEEAILTSKLKSQEAELARLGISRSSVTPESVSQTLLLRAPIPGVVTDMFLKTGEHVSTTDAILTILNREHEHVELQVFQQDLARVQKGMKVRMRQPGQTDMYDGEVFLVNTQLDVETLAANIHVHPGENFPKLPINGVVFSEIIYQVDEGLVLLSTELITEAGHYYLFVKTPEGFVRQEVEIGYNDGDHVEIKGPQQVLTAEVVVHGNYYLNGI